MSNPSPPPGWYPDPSGKPGQLFWDGSQWSAGVPAPPDGYSTAKKLFWAAFAGFVLMKAPAFTPASVDTKLGAFLTLAGFVVFVGCLIGGAVAAFTARRRRSNRSAPTDK